MKVNGMGTRSRVKKTATGCDREPEARAVVLAFAMKTRTLVMLLVVACRSAEAPSPPLRVAPKESLLMKGEASSSLRTPQKVEEKRSVESNGVRKAKTS